jgi:hypothetical protein
MCWCWQQSGLPSQRTDRCRCTHPSAPAPLRPPFPLPPPRLQELLGCLKQLLAVDRSWLPAQEGFSIYIRPFLYSSGEQYQVQYQVQYHASSLLPHWTSETHLLPLCSPFC